MAMIKSTLVVSFVALLMPMAFAVLIPMVLIAA
jgi:hypothetical protein